MLTIAQGVVKMTVGGQWSPESDAWIPAQKWLLSSGQGQSQMSWPGCSRRHDACVCSHEARLCLGFTLMAITTNMSLTMWGVVKLC